MIVLRALQGFFGGVLIPLAFTITLTMLPRSKQPVGMAMFMLSATFAPAIGPTIGGYLTETYGWQYIFYVNLVPGAIMLAALVPSLPRAPMQLGLLRGGDWPGIATLAIGLAAFQTVLEEGNKDDWFGSPMIVQLSLVAAIALSLFIWIELSTERPLLNLRLLLRRNFGLRQHRQCHRGHGALRIRVSAAELPVADAGLQCPAGRRGPGLDRPAATRADPVRAVADAPARSAAAGCRRPRAVRRKLLPEQRHQPGFWRGAVPGAEPGARRRPGAGHDAALHAGDRRHRAGAGQFGLRAVQHDAQSRRLDRHRAAADAADTARAVPLGNHQLLRLAAQRGDAAASRRPAALLHGDGTADPATAWHDAVVAAGRTSGRSRSSWPMATRSSSWGVRCCWRLSRRS